MKRVSLLLCLLGLLPAVQGAPKAGDVEPNLAALEAMLEQPEAKIDLARAKVEIDHMIDPKVDVVGTLRDLSNMADMVRGRFSAGANSHEKIETLRAYLYQAGPWNGGRPFRYDLEDPFGRDIRTKLLSTYLETRKGNCVSMPFLFLVLGQKIGLDVSAATAPEHVFLKFRDETARMVNVEATSGGYKLDESYRRDLPMTDQALANGLYMRALDKRETVALMATTLAEFYGKQRMPERRIAIADLILERYPKDVTAMLQKGHAYVQMMQRDFVTKYPTPNDIPPEKRQRYVELGRTIDLWYNSAGALGWRQPSDVQEANYADTVKQAKGARKGEQ